MIDEMKKGGVLEQIAGIQPHQFIEPPKHEGQVEVTGHIMSGFEKRCYTVMRRIKGQMIEKDAARASKETPSEEKGILNSEIRDLQSQYNGVKDLMYLSINDRCNLWGKRLGVSKGFKIVIPEKEVIVIGLPLEFPFSSGGPSKTVMEEAKKSGKCATCKASCVNAGAGEATH